MGKKEKKKHSNRGRVLKLKRTAKKERRKEKRKKEIRELGSV